MNADPLFEPLKVGNIMARNRLAMAPCTRQRAHLDGTPTDLMAEYYRQRAGAGILITEGIAPCAMGTGYLFTPGLFTDAHEAGWRKIADAVHSRDGAIFGQIMHVGRLSDPLLLPGGVTPKGPSAVRPDPTARHYTVTCPRPKRAYPEPEEMSLDEIKRTVDDYAACARRAQRAGLDGVELHGASGYLPMQFLSTNTNLRTDIYGGSIENRARFFLEVIDAMQAATSSAFVAAKVGPGWTFHNVFDEDPAATYSYVVRELSKRAIAFLEVGNYGQDWDVFGTLRPHFKGTMIGVAGLTRISSREEILSGRLDMAAFGQAYMANPDLEDRFKNDLGLTNVRPEFYYTQGSEGYSDYPVHAECAPDSLLPVDTRISQ